MGHNLNMSNGRASMFYVGDVPWHKLGTKLDNPATAHEAIVAAQLDYPVQKRTIKAAIRGRSTAIIPNHFATVRMDTGDVLGVVGSRYEPIQNRDAFAFFDPLVGRDEAIYHTAGVLGKGEQIWILAKLPSYIRVGKKDPVEKFVLLTNSHSGKTMVQIRLTPIRVVCQNTLSTALAGSEQEVRIRHTASAESKLSEAHKLLGLTNALYEELDFVFNRMNLRRITDKELQAYVKTLVPDNKEAESHARTENIRSKILELNESGRGSELSRGTLWGAYQACCEYADHVLHSKNPSKQLSSIWWGSGNALKQKAFTEAHRMLSN